MRDLITNPLFARALVVGVFGGIGLSLTAIYSRRGPLIYPVYAALLAALALLLARHSELPYDIRVVAALAGFATASLILYVTVGFLAKRNRRVLVEAGKLPRDAGGVSLLGHVWRWALLLGAGAVVSLAIAFVAA